LNKTVPFDVIDDFSPIAMIATSPLVRTAIASRERRERADRLQQS
jgi:hypothetical protein